MIIDILTFLSIYNMPINVYDIKNIYDQYCATQSDINEHLPVLYEYALKTNHITEFGTRFGCSTWAFLYSNPKKMISYDIKKQLEVEKIIEVANHHKINYTFVEADTLTIEIEQTDLMFIDTFHSYNQLYAELNRHHTKVNSYIIMHDTVTFGYQDMAHVGPISPILNNNINKQGLMNAINDFLTIYNQWHIEKHYTNNNGLLVLSK